MRRYRVIPVLLLAESGLVKTTNFRRPNYIGDPINAVRILNDKRVDELILLDISATQHRNIDVERIESIVSEAFMPVAYGGGIWSMSQCADLFSCGIEKIIVNSALGTDIGLLQRIADRYGSQALVASIDVRRTLWRGECVAVQNGQRLLRTSVVEMVRNCVSHGAGEILVTSIDREGTFSGYDLDLMRRVAECVPVPVIANGGAGCMEDFVSAVKASGCSAVAAGSMFVYSRKNGGVLINYPTEDDLIENFWSKVQ